MCVFQCAKEINSMSPSSITPSWWWWWWVIYLSNLNFFCVFFHFTHTYLIMMMMIVMYGNELLKFFLVAFLSWPLFLYIFVSLVVVLVVVHLVSSWCHFIWFNLQEIPPESQKKNRNRDRDTDKRWWFCILICSFFRIHMAYM